MLNDQINSDLDLWNLDGLTKFNALKGSGRIQLMNFKDLSRAEERDGREYEVALGSGHVRRVGVLERWQQNNPTLVALMPDECVLLGINTERPDKTIVLKDWEKEDYIDFAAQGQYLCMLSLKQKALEVFHLYGDKLMPLGSSRPLAPASFDVNSRLALSLNEDGKEPRPRAAYIVSGKKSQITVFPLSGKSPAETIQVNVGGRQEALGKEVYIAHDPVKRSLILSDTLNHRVIEVHLADQVAEVICGTGHAGVSDDEEPALSTSVNSPKGLALYRHAQVIDRAFLESATMLDYDRSGVKPRAILFAEAGSSCVRKLLDLPTQAEMHKLPSAPTLFTLMGRRKNSSREVESYAAGRDLRSYALADPIDVAVTRRGELLVGCAKALYFLRPLTSVGELMVQEKSKQVEMDFES